MPKRSLWKSITHQPSQSYASNAPTQPHLHPPSAARTANNPRIVPDYSSSNRKTTKSEVSYAPRHDDEENAPRRRRPSDVAHDGRRSGGRAVGGRPVDEDDSDYSTDSEEEEERRRRKKERKQQRVERKREQELDRARGQQPHHGAEPPFDAVQLRNERLRVTSGGSRDDGQGTYREGSSERAGNLRPDGLSSRRSSVSTNSSVRSYGSPIPRDHAQPYQHSQNPPPPLPTSAAAPHSAPLPPVGPAYGAPRSYHRSGPSTLPQAQNDPPCTYGQPTPPDSQVGHQIHPPPQPRALSPQHPQSQQAYSPAHSQYAIAPPLDSQIDNYSHPQSQQAYPSSHSQHAIAPPLAPFGAEIYTPEPFRTQQHHSHPHHLHQSDSQALSQKLQGIDLRQSPSASPRPAQDSSDDDDEAFFTPSSSFHSAPSSPIRQTPVLEDPNPMDSNPMLVVQPPTPLTFPKFDYSTPTTEESPSSQRSSPLSQEPSAITAHPDRSPSPSLQESREPDQFAAYSFAPGRTSVAGPTRDDWAEKQERFKAAEQARLALEKTDEEKLRLEVRAELEARKREKEERIAAARQSFQPQLTGWTPPEADSPRSRSTSTFSNTSTSTTQQRPTIPRAPSPLHAAIPLSSRNHSNDSDAASAGGDSNEDAYSGIYHDPSAPRIPPMHFDNISTSAFNASSRGTSPSGSREPSPPSTGRSSPAIITPTGAQFPPNHNQNQNSRQSPSSSYYNPTSSTSSSPHYSPSLQPPPPQQQAPASHPRLSALVAHPGRADSIRSTTSSASRYSQNSYRSELDVPAPIIFNSSNQQFSSPYQQQQPSYSAPPTRRNSLASGSIAHRSSLFFPPLREDDASSFHDDSASAVGGSRLSYLPRPTSTLIDSYATSTFFPSAPPSPPRSSHGFGGSAYPPPPRSDIGTSYSQRSRAKSFAASREDRADDLRSLRSFGGGGSEVGYGGGRRKLGSDVGSVSAYRMPQVMGGSAGDASSISGRSGHTSMALPSGAYKPSKSPSRYSSKLDLNTLGMPSTVMSTLSITSKSSSSNNNLSSSQSIHSSSNGLLSRRGSTNIASSSSSSSNAANLPPPTIHLQFSAHTPPPRKIGSTALLIRVFSVALDAYDALSARDASRGFVPGRAFVGKVLEWGEGVKGFSKGDWVYGLMGVRKSGALSEYVVVERRCLAHAPKMDEDEGFGLEEIASLPLLGIPAHRAVGTVLRGSRALVLLGSGTSTADVAPSSGGLTSPLTSASSPASHHVGSPDWAVGVLAAQELIARGVVVILQVPTYLGEEWAREAVKGLREGCVKVGESVEVVNGEHEGSFEFVLDCEGGRRIYDASRRIIATNGHFTSTKGDVEPTTDDGSSALGGSSDATKNSFRSLRRTFVKKDKKQINYSVVSPSGAGPIVDAMGEDVRDILEFISSSHPKIFRPPPVQYVVPFERGAEPFAVVPRGEGRGGRYRCEEEVWGVRLVQ